jgi:hypothetical protein
VGSETEEGDGDEVEKGTKDCEAVIKKKQAERDSGNKNGGGTENES